jgi:hypothetical protein
MNTWISYLNLAIGTYCLIGSIQGLAQENYMMTCAHALFFIAFQQATEESK